jgi:hypothetical protein
MSLERLSFFERRPGPRIEGATVTASCATPDGTVWLGDSSGVVRRLDARFAIVSSLAAFSEQVLQLAPAKQAVVALGQESDGSCRLSAYHLYRTDPKGEVLLLGSVKVPPGAVCVDVAHDFSTIIVGCANGQTLVYSGGLRVGIRPRVLVPDEVTPVVSVKFLNRTRFSILTGTDLTEVEIDPVGQLRVVHADPTGGAPSRDLVSVTDSGDILVARKNTVFKFVSGEGNVAAVPVTSGSNQPPLSLVTWAGHYFALSYIDKSIICWTSPSMRFIAGELSAGKISQVVPGAFDGHSCLILMSSGESVLMRERGVNERLTELVNAHQFEWAIELAKSEDLDAGKIGDLYRGFGDRYFEQGEIDKGVSVFTRAISEGYPLETSYVVNKLLVGKKDTEYLIGFLRELVSMQKANLAHTRLLLICLKTNGDTEGMEEVLSGLSVSELENILREFPEFMEFVDPEQILRLEPSKPLLELFVEYGKDELLQSLVGRMDKTKLEAIVPESPVIKLALCQGPMDSPHSDLETALRTKSFRVREFVKDMITHNRAEEAMRICKLFGAPAAVILQIAQAAPTLAIDAMAYPAIALSDLRDSMTPELGQISLGVDAGPSMLDTETPVSLLLASVARTPVEFGLIKSRLVKEFKQLEKSIKESSTHAENDDCEISRMKSEIDILKRKPIFHKLSVCSLCGLPITTLPCILFKCTHAFHPHCAVPDSDCTVCQLDSKHHFKLLEQRQAVVSDHDALFRKMAGSDGNRFDVAMAYLGHGLFS